MVQPVADQLPRSSLRVGVDLVRVEDVRQSIARFGDRYVTRLFTADEIAYCARDHQPAARFAARFAAKEAMIKILRPAPHEGIDWRFIEVRRALSGACELALSGSAATLARRAGISEVSMCMSHEHAYATATVVARLVPATDPDAPAGSNTAHTAGVARGWYGQSSQNKRGTDGA